LDIQQSETNFVIRESSILGFFLSKLLPLKNIFIYSILILDFRFLISELKTHFFDHQPEIL